MLIIILVILIFLVLNKKYCKNENMNEGSFNRVERTIKNNFIPNQYLNCAENIENNNFGNTYCYDKPVLKEHNEKIFKLDNWEKINYKSYFYPAYSSNIYNTFSPDWTHIINKK